MQWLCRWLDVVYDNTILYQGLYYILINDFINIHKFEYGIFLLK